MDVSNTVIKKMEEEKMLKEIGEEGSRQTLVLTDLREKIRAVGGVL